MSTKRNGKGRSGKKGGSGSVDAGVRRFFSESPQDTDSSSSTASVDQHHLPDSTCCRCHRQIQPHATRAQAPVDTELRIARLEADKRVPNYVKFAIRECAREGRVTEPAREAIRKDLCNAYKADDAWQRMFFRTLIRLAEGVAYDHSDQGRVVIQYVEHLNVMYARVVFMHLAGTPGCETMDSMLSLSSESGSSDEDGDEES